MKERFPGLSNKDFEPVEQKSFAEYLLEVCTKEEFEKDAKEKGCVVEYPQSNQLYIDIDTLAQDSILKKGLDVLDDNSIEYKIEERLSKSGNKHFIITLPFEVSDSLRVAFQAALGSDPKRELLACLRCIAGAEIVTVLYRPVEVKK